MAVDSNEGGGSEQTENGCKGALKLVNFCIKNYFRFCVETQLAKAWIEWMELVQTKRL